MYILVCQVICEIFFEECFNFFIYVEDQGKDKFDGFDVYLVGLYKIGWYLLGDVVVYQGVKC